MSPEPFSFQHALSDFDLTRIPVNASLIQSNPAMLVSAVQTYYQERFRKLGGTAAIAVKDGIVSVAWHPKEGNSAEQVFEYALSLLREGEYRLAEPLLRALLARNQDHADALYNLGMMLSDQRRLPEAIELLNRFLNLEPESSQGWTALGVAHARKGDPQNAISALKKSLELDSNNGYAMRNLGALLIEQSPADALPIFEMAVRLMPDDQATQYGYAQCLLRLGRTDEADAAFLSAIKLSPLSEIAELARSARTAIAHKTLRSASGGLRPDAVFYCLDGLKKFRELGETQMRAIVYEVAMLGRSGLDINDSAKKYSLRSLPGTFSGLHLVSIMYTGLKLLDPNADAGIDLSQEFTQAKRLFENPPPPDQDG